MNSRWELEVRLRLGVEVRGWKMTTWKAFVKGYVLETEKADGKVEMVGIKVGDGKGVVSEVGKMETVKTKWKRVGMGGGEGGRGGRV